MDIETNIEGFQLLTGKTLAEALVAAGMISREVADAALARRAERRRAALAEMTALDEETEAKHPGWMTGKTDGGAA